jgi:acetyl-CoA carboxylase biotin carboxyl carrier protein
VLFKDIDIEELFRLMQTHDIDETTLQNGKTIVTVKRNKEPVVVSTQGVLNTLERSQPEAVAREAEISSPAAAQGTESGEDKATSTGEAYGNHYHPVLAPLVGTFYRASAPDADPFVQVGDRINVGDVICIVEAMKSMNEIQSDVSGVVKEVCVDNAQMVEFEQPLIKVDTGKG